MSTDSAVLALITKLLGPLSPAAKAIIPAVLTLLAAVLTSLANHQVDAQAVSIAVTGLVSALITYLVPNAKPPAK